MENNYYEKLKKYKESKRIEDRINYLESVEYLHVNIDTINGFAKFGNLADPYISHIIPEVIKVNDDFIKNGDAIAYIMEGHTKDSTEFQWFAPHCLQNTDEAAIVDELKKYLEYGLIYEKNCTNGMECELFRKDLNYMTNLREVYITGCCTDICIMNFAIALRNYFNQKNINVKVKVVEKAVETYDAPNHPRDDYNKWAFNFMRQAGVEMDQPYQRRKVK